MSTESKELTIENLRLFKNGEGCHFLVKVGKEEWQIPFKCMGANESVMTKWAGQRSKRMIMRPGGGRDKGASFELDAADKLSMWWWGVKRGLRRCPMSGGWSRTKAAGDIISELEPFPLSVECKHNKSWTWSDLFHPTMGVIGDFWKQCVEECPPERQPLLVFRGNGGKTYCMYEAEKLNLSRAWPEGNKSRLISFNDYRNVACNVVLFDDLLLKVDPELLIHVDAISNFGNENIELWRQQRSEAAAKFGSKSTPPISV